MQIKIVNVRPHQNKKRDYFVDFTFVGWGLIVKGARIRFLKQGNMRCDLPYLEFEKKDPKGKLFKTRYSPLCFDNKEQQNLCKKLVMDEFVRQAVSFKEQKHVSV